MASALATFFDFLRALASNYFRLGALVWFKEANVAEK